MTYPQLDVLAWRLQRTIQNLLWRLPEKEAKFVAKKTAEHFTRLVAHVAVDGRKNRVNKGD